MMTEPFFRRNLPHWQPLGASFFLTYRLAGTLPRQTLSVLEEERERLDSLPRECAYSPKEWQMRIERQLFARWDECLDRDTRIQWLADPRVAAVVRDNLYHHAGSKYSLLAYVIMPNHVHILIKPEPAWERRFEDESRAMYERGPLSATLHSLRSYTAKEANRILGRTGVFWQGEAYDHWVRNNAEFERIVYYIESNPVNAGLVACAEDWQASSAYDRMSRSLGPYDRLA